jgi:hypothetical protein
MKLKALLLALFTAGFAVSVAVAASPATVDHGKPTTSTSTDGSTTSASHGKGKGHAKAAACKPARKIVVTGEFVAAGAGGFAMKVTGGNKPAKAWKDKQATVLVDDKTKFNGKKKLADFVAGDRLNVQGFACKADVAAGSLLARKVRSKAPKVAEDEADEKSTTTATDEVVTTDAVTTNAS